jgi:hypothetical protein
MSASLEGDQVVTKVAERALGISVGILALIGVAIGVYRFYEWYTLTRHENAVYIRVSTSRDECKDDQRYPLWILIDNSSGRVLERTEFALEARRKGRSSDIAVNNFHTDDHILQPGTGFWGCYSAPKLRQDATPNELEWSISHTRLYFKD